MKKKYLKPEMQVIVIEKQVMLAGSVNGKTSDGSGFTGGGNTSDDDFGGMD